MAGKAEFSDLWRQFVTSNPSGTQYVPMAFTEQGVAMISSVLCSGRAVNVNIALIRAFIQMRGILSTQRS